MLRPLIDFKPAQLVETQRETYVSYYVRNPFTDCLERRRIRLNYIHSKTERRKYGRLLSLEINDKLYHGWNPFLEELQKKGVPTLEAAVGEFLRVKTKLLRPDSIRCYRSWCKIISEWIEAHGLSGKYCVQFDRAVAARFMRDMESRENVSAKTFNNYLIFYNTLFLWFVKKGYVPENPFEGIDRKRVEGKIRETVPPNDRKRILNYFRETCPEYVYVMMLCFKYFIRPKEILMLRIADISFDEGLVTVPSSVAKNHKERTVALAADVLDYFNTLRDKDNRFYIFSEDYKPGKKLLTTRDTGRTWSQMRNALGLPKSYQFYSLKDTGITEMLEAGVPAKYVKELADHSSLEMTEKYVHKSNAKKILEYNNLKF